MGLTVRHFSWICTTLSITFSKKWRLIQGGFLQITSYHSFFQGCQQRGINNFLDSTNHVSICSPKLVWIISCTRGKNAISVNAVHKTDMKAVWFKIWFNVLKQEGTCIIYLSHFQAISDDTWESIVLGRKSWKWKALFNKRLCKLNPGESSWVHFKRFLHLLDF